MKSANFKRSLEYISRDGTVAEIYTHQRATSSLCADSGRTLFEDFMVHNRVGRNSFAFRKRSVIILLSAGSLPARWLLLSCSGPPQMGSCLVAGVLFLFGPMHLSRAKSALLFRNRPRTAKNQGYQTIQELRQAVWAFSPLDTMADMIGVSLGTYSSSLCLSAIFGRFASARAYAKLSSSDLLKKLSSSSSVGGVVIATSQLLAK